MSPRTLAGLRLFTEYVAESRDTVIEREAFHDERVVFVDDSVLSGREYVEVQLERRVAADEPHHGAE